MHMPIKQWTAIRKQVLSTKFPTNLVFSFVTTTETCKTYYDLQFHLLEHLSTMFLTEIFLVAFFFQVLENNVYGHRFQQLVSFGIRKNSSYVQLLTS